MSKIFHSYFPCLRDVESILNSGFGALIHDNEGVIGLQKCNNPLLWHENLVVVASTRSGLCSLLPDKKIHVLTGDPNLSPQLSSQGKLFCTSYVEGVADQVIVACDAFAGGDEHNAVLALLRDSKIKGIISRDPSSWSEGFKRSWQKPLRGPQETGFSLITFDLDGVLVESKELHRDAFLVALEEAGPEYLITVEEHNTFYCGLSTKQKLRKLTQEKELPPGKHDQVFTRKQYHTLEMMKTQIQPDPQIIGVFQALRKAGYPIAVASNCIKSSVFYLLQGIGVLNQVAFYFSNEDVSQPKPDPEIYLSVAEHFGVSPDEMLVVEDSGHGKQAALLSGAQLCSVTRPADVTVDYLASSLAVRLCNKPVLNILMPMAGQESLLFPGTTTPKFLLDIAGVTLLERIVDNLRPQRAHRFIFIARQYQARAYKLREACVKACKYQPLVLLEVKQKSSSALETALIARDIINSDEPLMIANLNMWPFFKSPCTVDTMSAANADCVMTHFISSSEVLSYVKLDAQSNVANVSVKVKTSDLAVTGYTVFRKGSMFVKLCDSVLKAAKTEDGDQSAPVYMEDVVKAAMHQKQCVASTGLECLPIRQAKDFDALKNVLSC